MSTTQDFLATHCRELDLSSLVDRVVIYFLISKGKIVYIGQTATLSGRITIHRADKTFDRVFWFDVDAADGDAYEGALIRCFNPRRSFNCRKDYGRDAEILASFGLTPNPKAREKFEARRRKRWPRTQNRVDERHVQRFRARRLFAALDRMFADRAERGAA